MPADSSIYFQQKVPDYFGLAFDGYEQGMRLGDMIRKRKDQKALKDLWQSSRQTNPDGTQGINFGQLISGAGEIDPELGVKYTQYQKELEKLDREKIESDRKGNESTAQIKKTLADANESNARADLYRSGGRGVGGVRLGNSLAGNGMKAPPGYRFTEDGGQELIPGSPADMKDEMRRADEAQTAGLVVQDLGRTLNKIDSSYFASGPVMGQSASIPGTPAWETQQLLDSVKANVGFDKLKAMRASSPTGAALGAVSDKETAMLQATAGKLDPRLRTPMLRDNVKRLLNQYNDVVHGPGNGPPRFQLSFDDQGNPVNQQGGVVPASYVPAQANSPRDGGGRPIDTSHDAALAWAQKNLNDPRAMKILRLHGIGQ